MKKLLVGAIALGLASAVVSSPAYAEHNEYQQQYHHKHGGRVTFGITIGNTSPYNYNNRYYDYNNSYYDYNNDNRYRNDRFLSYRYFSRLPSYYPGRCNYTDVVVRDPYTSRIVCMSRYEYERYRYEVRNRF